LILPGGREGAFVDEFERLELDVEPRDIGVVLRLAHGPIQPCRSKQSAADVL
jgi:hypothetical protein